MNDFEITWHQYRQRVENALDERLKLGGNSPPSLTEPMRYVCLGGGKRLRALLVYACGELAGASPDQLDAPACAVEMIHAYSLTHDDLPCMDDDDLRRGKATCHVAFDEATAVLAGDALQAFAFSVISEEVETLIPTHSKIKMIRELAHASGANGMVGGQILDMEAVGKHIGYDQLTSMHKLKTGALIRASALLGGFAGKERDPELIQGLTEYAEAIGLAFQITDDILDVTKSSETLGKPAGSDDRMDKSTYVSLIGLEASVDEANRLCTDAIQKVRKLGENTQFLEQLARFVVTRSY